MPIKPFPSIDRGGAYYRVCKPDWIDFGDTEHSKTRGGRWNPAGEFGALNLNASLRVAAAQARHQHVGRAIGLFDLRPERRPSLAVFNVPLISVVDVVNAASLRVLGLPQRYPVDVAWEPCQRIARRVYPTGIAGIAARSHAEARVGHVVGEELAYFDSQVTLSIRKQQRFQEWYPDQHPTN